MLNITNVLYILVKHCSGHWNTKKECNVRQFFFLENAVTLLETNNQWTTDSNQTWTTTLINSVHRRIYITPRTDSPPFRLPVEGLSQPLSACTDGSYTDWQLVQYTADHRRRIELEDKGNVVPSVCGDRIFAALAILPHKRLN